MDFDMRSFLSGLSVGRQLKGWAVVAKDSDESRTEIWIEAAQMVRRGSRQDVSLGALPALTATDAPEVSGVMIYKQGGYQDVSLGALPMLTATDAPEVSGVSMELDEQEDL